MKVLLVEDERRMSDAIAELLRQEGYEVTVCGNGTDGLQALITRPYDIAILDVMLPGLNGFEIVRAGREAGVKTPTLLLTAKAELSDKVTGLDSGADDYLTKPFQVPELLARLRALSRRNRIAQDCALAFGDLTLDEKHAALFCTATGQEVRLSDKETRILEYLFRNQRQIVSREALALKVWGYESNAEYNNVEVYISFVRKKLAFIGSHTEIKAVRGLGYELRYEHV